jgi:MYND finger
VVSSSATANDSSGISSSSSSTVSSSGNAAAAAAASAAACSDAVHGSGKQKKQKVKQPCANVNCNKLTTKLCRRCAAVYYCSTECQKVCFKDAKHRVQCAEMASAIV